MMLFAKVMLMMRTNVMMMRRDRDGGDGEDDDDDDDDDDCDDECANEFCIADEDVDGMPVITGVTLTCQVIMETKDVQGLAAKLTCKDNSRNYSVVSIEVSEPSEEIRLQACLKNANKQIFELIQKVQ